MSRYDAIPERIAKGQDLSYQSEAVRVPVGDIRYMISEVLSIPGYPQSVNIRYFNTGETSLPQTHRRVQPLDERSS